jgi:hypothetical protein
MDKSAVDAGFDVRREPAAGWLTYASTSCPLVIGLSVIDGHPVAALSMTNVLEELGLPRLNIGNPSGFVGAFSVADFNELQVLLGRAYELSRALPHELLHTWNERVEALPATERQATVKQRVGQDLFRQGLLALWQGRCALTGLAIPELLRASHAKPWSIATDEERLDVYNGLLLAAHLDAAFDHGLITFTSTGALQISSRLEPKDWALLGLDRAWPAIMLRPRHLPYLVFHQEQVFFP